MKVRSLLALAVTASLFSSAAALAATPRFLSQQGRLLDVAGRPITGDVKIVFSLYTQPTEGTAFWSETLAWLANVSKVLIAGGGSMGVPFLAFSC